MARIPDTELERQKEEVSVERLVEASGVVLKKAGQTSTPGTPTPTSRPSPTSKKQD